MKKALHGASVRFGAALALPLLAAALFAGAGTDQFKDAAADVLRFLGATAGLTTGDPFPDPVPAAGAITVGVVEFASLPFVDGAPARMMLLVDEPGTGRLFVNDQRGFVYTVSHDGGTVTRYLDLTDPRWGIGGGKASCCLFSFAGFASHPQFGLPGTPGFGRLYALISLTARPAAFPLCEGRDAFHDTVLLEWTAADPAAAIYDGGPPREVLCVEDPFRDHNGGGLGFNPLAALGDPDFGLLYVGLGDGGWGGDEAQDLGSLLGKILRIDPLGSNSANGRYGIPADNPFANGGAAVRGEIYAYGLRNPRRFVWDERNGNLFVADIGQRVVEEISLVPRGGNLGWNDWEGSFRFISLRRGVVSPADPRGEAGFVYPVVEYDHLDPLFQPAGAAAVTGLAVYRHDAVPPLANLVLFGDLPSGEVFGFSADDLPDGGQDAIRRVLFDDGDGPKTLLSLIREKNASQGRRPARRADLRFGSGPDGQIFLLNEHDGVIRRLVPRPAPRTVPWQP